MNLSAWLHRFRLKKQLFIIILIITMILGLLSTFVLRVQIDGLVNNEVYNTLTAFQNQILYRYQHDTFNNLELSETESANIIHFIYNHQTNTLTSSKPGLIPDFVLAQLISVTQDQLVESQNYQLMTANMKNLYRVSKIDENRSIISLMPANYVSDYRNLIFRLVLTVVLIALFVMLGIFLLWIGSIINPLNNMVQYLTSDQKRKRKIKIDTHRADEIGDVAKSIVSMEKELSFQEKQKMEMIHNISHDLKTPITTIKSYSESIKDGIYPYQTLEKSLDVIIDNANRLERKAHSLLLLNHIEAINEMETDLRPFGMKEVVNKVLLSLKVVRPEIELQANLKQALFIGEQENWRICIENLLDNAIRYAHSKVVITLNDHSITVFNDGEQMSNDRIERLFRPYEKGTDGQFGLGLSIVYRLSEKMGYKTSGYNVKDGVEFKIEKKQDPFASSKLRFKRNRNS